MKFKYIISFIVISGMLACSEGFTDLAPESQRNAGIFYKTASDMQVAVNAIYSPLKSDGSYDQALWVMQELRSDNTFWDGTGLAELITVYDKFSEDATIDIAEDAWNAAYLGIFKSEYCFNKNW